MKPILMRLKIITVHMNLELFSTFFRDLRV